MIYLYAIGITFAFVFLYGEYRFHKWRGDLWKKAHDWQTNFHDQAMKSVLGLIKKRTEESEDPADWWKKGRKNGD